MIFAPLWPEGGEAARAVLRRNSSERSIVVMQLAITMTLLIGAGLLGRDFMRVLSVDPGFCTRTFVAIDLALHRPLPDMKIRRAQFLNDLFSRMRALPGVEDVGGTRCAALAYWYFFRPRFAVVNAQQLSAKTQECLTALRRITKDTTVRWLKLYDFFITSFPRSQIPAKPTTLW